MKFDSCDHSDYRERRVRKAVRIALAICGLTQDQADLLIRECNDQKGMLCVAWHVYPPSDEQRRAFTTAWMICDEDSVAHYPSEWVAA